MPDTRKRPNHNPEALTQVSPDDLVRLTEILSDAFDARAEELAEFIPLAIDAPYSDVLISRDTKGRIASFMIVSLIHGTRGIYGRIDDVATHPDSRRQGHAGAVLDCALRWFQERGVKEVSLHSEDGHEIAHRMYKAKGFYLYDTNQFQLTL